MVFVYIFTKFNIRKPDLCKNRAKLQEKIFGLVLMTLAECLTWLNPPSLTQYYETLYLYSPKNAKFQEIVKNPQFFVSG